MNLFNLFSLFTKRVLLIKLNKYQVPEGYKLVPKIPTKKMVETTGAIYGSNSDYEREVIENYELMIAYAEVPK